MTGLGENNTNGSLTLNSILQPRSTKQKSKQENTVDRMMINNGVVSSALQYN